MAKIGVAACSEIPRDGGNDGGHPAPERTARAFEGCREKNGCTAEQIQEVLLLLALYCGIPAANEAHRIAAEVLNEAKEASRDYGGGSVSRLGTGRPWMS